MFSYDEIKEIIREEIIKLIRESQQDSSADEADGDPDLASEAAPKRKRVVRKGKLRFKMTCPDGWSWDKNKNICVLPPRSTQIKRSRASKRGARKRRAFTSRISKNRRKSMRKLRPSLKRK